MKTPRTPDEVAAITGICDLSDLIIRVLDAKDVTPAQICCVLRITLFIAEEMLQGRPKSPALRDTVMEMILTDYREDCARYDREQNQHGTDTGGAEG